MAAKPRALKQYRLLRQPFQPAVGARGQAHIDAAIPSGGSVNFLRRLGRHQAGCSGLHPDIDVELVAGDQPARCVDQHASDKITPGFAWEQHPQGFFLMQMRDTGRRSHATEHECGRSAHPYRTAGGGPVIAPAEVRFSRRCKIVGLQSLSHGSRLSARSAPSREIPFKDAGLLDFRRAIAVRCAVETSRAAHIIDADP